jgi:hypothetical protein
MLWPTAETSSHIMWLKSNHRLAKRSKNIKFIIGRTGFLQSSESGTMTDVLTCGVLKYLSHFTVHESAPHPYRWPSAVARVSAVNGAHRLQRIGLSVLARLSTGTLSARSAYKCLESVCACVSDGRSRPRLNGMRLAHLQHTTNCLSG